MRQTLGFLLALAAGWGAFGCASIGPKLEPLRPGTGDVSFRLLWSGDADLDLHVTEPSGKHVGFVQPWMPGEGATSDGYLARLENQSETGVLDVDCNAASDRHCPTPMENVFWPVGTADPGTYEVWVELFRPPADGTPVDYVVEIRRGERVAERLRGQLAGAREASGVSSFEFARQGAARGD